MSVEQTHKKRATVSVGSGAMVRLRLALTPSELETLIRLTAMAANDDADTDAADLQAIYRKIKYAVPNIRSQPHAEDNA